MSSKQLFLSFFFHHFFPDDFIYLQISPKNFHHSLHGFELLNFPAAFSIFCRVQIDGIFPRRYFHLRDSAEIRRWRWCRSHHWRWWWWCSSQFCNFSSWLNYCRFHSKQPIPIQKLLFPLHHHTNDTHFPELGSIIPHLARFPSQVTSFFAKTEQEEEEWEPLKV